MKKILAILILLPLFAKTQIITTVFGPNDTLSCGGWGSSIAVDHLGNYYVSQECDNSVYKITPSGVLSRIAGNGGVAAFGGDGGPATAASLYEPMGVAVDNIGNVYIADMSNERIRKVDLSGTITTVAGIGSSIPTIGGFSGDGGPATAAELFQPAGVYVNNAGDVYIADADNGRIRRVDNAGIITTIVGSSGSGWLGDGGPATSAQMNEPASLAFDPAGNMYICDGYGGNRIRKVDTAGIISTVAGTGSAGYNGDGIAGTSAEINIPRGVAVDASGNVYIADNVNHRIRMVDKTGTITTVAGTGAPGFSGDGGLSTLADINSGNITVDRSGDLIISDLGNDRIRKINTSILAVSALTTTGSVKLYPNPANKILNITCTNKITQLTITDLIGQTIYTNICSKNNMQVDISALPSGMYFAIVNNLEVLKFVKDDKP